MQVSLSEQIALVTGGAHRVGKAIALELARGGAHVVIHYGKAEDEAAETVREIKSFGVKAMAVHADLRDPASVAGLVDAAYQAFGRLDILVNNASAFLQRRLLDISLDEWNDTLAVNLTAPFITTQAAAHLMQANDPPGGVIINILDKGALSPWPKYAHHGISKAGLWMLTQVSAASLGPHIRVNAVLPGPVMKPAGRDMSDDDWAKVGARSVLQRGGEAEDVARAVAYLATEDYLTGTLIHVNGGEHLWKMDGIG